MIPAEGENYEHDVRGSRHAPAPGHPRRFREIGSGIGIDPSIPEADAEALNSLR
jgi:hypothetical protein